VPRFGASGAEWFCFAYELGLMSDILPVLSNPQAIISPDSELTKLGKVPSRYNAKRQAVGIKKWTSHQSTTAEIDLWSKEQDYGLCVQTRRVRALDLDLEDAAEIGAVLSVVRNAGHALPCRYRSASFRRLLAFRLDSGAFAKRTIKRDSGIIEFLADGQQFVAAGAHPDCGHYQWEGGLPGSIPTLTVEEFEDLWKTLGGSAAKHIAQRHPAGESADPRSEADPTLDHLSMRGWILGAGPDDAFYITCPWKDDHTGDSGPTETVYWPRGSGGYAQGHFKCLHAHCDARSDDDFLRAVGLGVETQFPDLTETAEEVTEHAGTPSDRSVSAPGSRGNGSAATVGLVGPGVLTTLGLARTQAGYRPSFGNLARALRIENFWRRLAWDEFRGELVSCDWRDAVGEEHWETVTHNLALEARERLERAGFAAIGADVFRDALQRVGWLGRFDSAQLWLEAQRWDGVRRVDSMLQTYWGAAEGDYSASLGRFLMSALAGRVLQPGVQCDMVVIFVGAQGLGKTRGCEALCPFPGGYVTLDLSVRDADLARRMQGKCLGEFADLRGLHTRDINAIKSFVSEREDTWTPKYQEKAISSPRRCVFVGTANHDDFLDDETGERRWLPVRVTRVEREALTQDRAQLWAEGAALFLSEGVAWAQAERLAQFEHSEFKASDVWLTDAAQLIRVAPIGQHWSTRDMAVALGLDIRTLSRAQEMRIAHVLSNLCLTKTRPQKNGLRQYIWTKVNDLPDSD